MNKLTIFLLAAVFAFVSFGSSSPKVVAVENYPTLIIPTATPKTSAKVERLELDRKEVLIPCPPMEFRSPAFENNPCFEDIKGSVKVKTIVSNPKNKKLTYEYTVSGGRITGEGEEVVWDLKSVRPGTYTITAAINEGRGFLAQPQSQTIIVRECNCPHICICPTLSVTGGGIIKAGETMTFEANVSGGSAAEITYNWTVSQGEIIEGQRTPKITVKTSSGMSGNITATVEIGGSGLCSECPRTASETGGIEK